MKNLPWFVSIKDYTLPNYIDIHGEYSIIRYQKDSFMNQIRILWFGSRKWVVLPNRFFADFFGVFLESVLSGDFWCPGIWKFQPQIKVFSRDSTKNPGGAERASILGPGVGRSKCFLPWGLPVSKSRMWCMQCTRFMRWERIFQINDWEAEEVWTMRIRLKLEFFEKGLVKCDTSRCI